MKTAIIIPTYNRLSLLARLLQSISEATWPDSVIGVWVVENGEMAGSDKIVNDFKEKIIVNYVYENRAGPSFARNRGIQESKADYFIFFDDDVRIGKDTLQAYANAFRKYDSQTFFGGPLEIDYETAPESWLLDFLPWSAQGTDLGSIEKIMTEPLLLGANHAIPRVLLDRCGDFDPLCPVGQTGMLGEETRLQQRLLKSGAKGVYLPEAVVWHYVPAERCSENWALERQFRRGLSNAARLGTSVVNGRRLLKVPLWIWKEYFIELLGYLKAMLAGS
jgi:glycosyltransferase involved in cell wall biosynthesis